MFILTSFTLPPAARTAFSRIGVSCLQGPHQGAQKSTSTGCCMDSARTSWRKFAVVVSFTRSSEEGTGVSDSMRSSKGESREKNVLVHRADFGSDALDGSLSVVWQFRRRFRQVQDEGIVPRGAQEGQQILP